MLPVLAVIQSSSSFHQIWKPLALSAGAELRVVDMRAASAATAGASLVIVSAGGVELEAEDMLRRLIDCSGRGSVPTAVVGALCDHRLAVQLVRAGADEYFALPADMDALSTWMTRVVERARCEIEQFVEADRESARYDYSRFIGRSASMRAVLVLTSRITPHRDASVLLTGETGTGKELVAHAIHYNGPRASQPFVEVNCSALPATLLEAELFGYEAGAFTDARTAKPGLFEVARGGTLFLDEIGELPIEMQAKLLRILEEKRVRRLGATQPVTIDVRIIAATHVDLAAAVRTGRFRQDLYYRLDICRIHLPPLRERVEDIIPLAEHFLRQFSERHRTPAVRVTQDMRRTFLTHSWPGNVRELRNAIERAVVFGPGALRLVDPPAVAGSVGGTLPFPSDMKSIQQAAARAMVERHRGNKSAAAGALGISRKRLYTLLGASAQPSPETAIASGQHQSASFVHERARSRDQLTEGSSVAFWL